MSDSEPDEPVLEYRELEWDGHKMMELLERLSMIQCVEYLMNGYIQKHATKLQFTIYPFALRHQSHRFVVFKKPPYDQVHRYRTYCHYLDGLGCEKYEYEEKMEFG